jgi:hypothetical protein
MKDYIKGRWKVAACDAADQVSLDLSAPERTRQLSADQLKNQHYRASNLCSTTDDNHACYAMHFLEMELSKRGWCSENPDLDYWLVCEPK